MARILPNEVLAGKTVKPLYCPFQSGSVIGTPCDLAECALYRVVKNGNEVVSKGCVFQVEYEMMFEAFGKALQKLP